MLYARPHSFKISRQNGRNNWIGDLYVEGLVIVAEYIFFLLYGKETSKEFCHFKYEWIIA